MSDNMDNRPTGQPTPAPAQPMGQPQQPIAQPAPVQPTAQPQPAPVQPAAQPVSAPVQAPAPAKPASPAPAPKTPTAPDKPTSATQAGSDNKNNNNNTPPKKKKKKKKRKSDWGGRLITAILSIILGFVLGVGSVFGTVSAIIYSIGTQPVDETVELVDTIVPTLNLSELLFDDEGGILSEQYANKKIMDLVGDVADAISGLANEKTTIKNVTDISPFVGVQLQKLIGTVRNDFGIPLDYETLLNTTIAGGVKEEGSLTKQLLDDVMNTQLCSLLETFLGGEEMNPILKYLCYGKLGVDYTLDENGNPKPIVEGDKFLTIKELASEGGEEVLYGLEIAALLSIDEYDPTDPIHAILFKNDENGEKIPVAINDLIHDSQTIINGIKIAEILGETEYDPTDPIHSIIFKNDIDADGNPVKVPVSVGDFIDDSQTIINGIKIAEILGETEYDSTDPIHAILFKDSTDADGNPVKVPVSVGDFMGDSQTIIDGIKIAEILGEGTYDPTNSMHAILFKDSTDADGNSIKVPVTVADLTGDFIDSIKVAEILGEGTYDPTNPMHAILFKDDTNGDKVPVALKDLTGDFIDNIKVAEILGETIYDSTNPMHAILFKDGTDADGNSIKVPVALKELTGDFINNIKVAEILGISPDDDNTLTSILYDEAGNALTINDLSEFDLNGIKLSEVLTLKKETSEVLLSIVFKGEYKLEGSGDDAVYVPIDDKEENASRTIGELTTDMTTIINGIKLDSVLTVDETTHPALLSIIYVNGDKTNPRTIEMLSSDSASIINGIKLKDVIGESNTNPVIKSLLTTTNDEGDEIDTTLAHLTDEEQSKKIINSIKLDSVITVDETTHSALLSIIYVNGDKTKPRTIEMLSTDSTSIINGIKLKDVIGADNTNLVIKSLLTTTDSEGNEIPTTLAHLTNSAESEKIINGIKLKDVIGESNTNPVIKSLLTTTDSEGNEIPTTLAHLTNSAESEKLINNIKLADVIETDDKMMKSILFVDSDENKPRTLGDFTGGGAQDIINTIKLADVLNITDDSHPALIFLAYGSNEITGTPRTLGQIRTMGDDLINDIPLSYIITPDMNSTIVCYLLYGKEGIHYTAKTKVENGATIKYAEPLQRHIIINGGVAYNEYGEAISSTSYTLNGTSTYTELNGDGDEDNVTYNLTAGTRADGTAVYYLSKDGETVYFTECTLKEFATDSNSLTKLTARLTAGDILGDEIDTNPMLKHLKDTPINELGAAVETLTFEQVFYDQIYRKNASGQFVDENDNVVSEDNRVLGDIWHYMLTGLVTDEYGNQVYEADGVTPKKDNFADKYSIVNDMDKLIENMKREVHDATLDRLAHDKILQISDSILNDTIITEIRAGGITFTVDVPSSANIPTNARIGSLTTEQILVYVEALLATIDKINSFS